MAEENSPESSETPSPERLAARSVPNLNGAVPLVEGSDPNAPRGPRKVYQPTLLTPRKRRRLSPFLVIPTLLLILGLGLYGLWLASHQRRFVPTAGQIAFASDQGSPGTSHVWLAKADGSGAHRLTKTAAAESSPTYSPDGSQIAYLSPGEKGLIQVFLADADGAGVQQATRTAGAKASPEFAPSSQTLLGMTTAGALTVTDVVAHDNDRLLPPLAEKAASSATGATVAATATVPSFTWAPSTDREKQGLAAVLEQNTPLGIIQTLAVLPVFTGDARVTQDGKPGSPPLVAADALSLAWSPSGGLLAVAAKGIKGLPGGKNLSAILLCDSQGAVQSQPPIAAVPDAKSGPENPLFSPDGSQLIFEVWSQKDLASRKQIGLFSAPIDASHPPEGLIQGSAEHSVFTADGKSLLFLKLRPDGKHDLYRVNLDGSALTQLSDGSADVTSIALSPQKAK